MLQQQIKRFVLLSFSCFVFTNFLGAMENESLGLRELFAIVEPTSPIACSRGTMLSRACPPLLWDLYEAVLRRDLTKITALATIPSPLINYSIDDRENTLLHLMLKSQHPEEDQRIIECIVKILLQNKSLDLIATNSAEETPLHVAITENLLGCAILITQAIRQRNFLPNIQNLRKETTLHLAVAQNAIPVVEAILDNPRIDVSVLNEQNQTPLDIAEEFGFDGLVELLRKYAAKNASAIMPDLQLPTHGHRRQPSSLDGEVFIFEADEEDSTAPAAPVSAPSILQHHRLLFPDMESGYGVLGT